MVLVHADLRGAELTTAERQEQARHLLSFARGYIAGVSDSVEELAAELKRESEEEAA
jgi:hypothetical protein